MKRLEEEIKNKVIEASRKLSPDVYEKLKKAYEREDGEEGRIVLKAILDNIGIASKTGLPLCQDTGMFWVLVSYASSSPYSLNELLDTVKSALEKAAEEGYFRKSIVSEPVFDRLNTKSNLPAVINIELIEGDVSTVDVLLKGFGSENCSAVRMLNPTAGKEGVVSAVLEMVKAAGGKPCPPMFLGIGIGGSLDRAALLSKKALIAKREHDDERYDELEEEILEKVNTLGIGAGGLGGKNTALEVNIEYEGTHIAGLPVALSVSCWADRKAHIEVRSQLWKED
ncbi:MAG TPA: fumarate hydratase [Candidatus Ornithospirochaeta stercorigallinarum]|nr:fumarate hydratase [Candidatus Ornithospirochaeta stercorigallinarum]